MNKKIAGALIGLLMAVSVGAEDFKWPATNFADIVVAAREQTPPVILVKGGGVSQPDYLRQCRMGGRVGRWTWFEQAREQVCGSDDGPCPGLQCRQATWTGFTPDCSRPGVCTEWARP